MRTHPEARKRRAFTLVEALVTITVATLVAFGLFQSSFTSIRATAQTEQGLDVTDIVNSEFADVLSQNATLSLPLHEKKEIEKGKVTFTVTTNVTQDLALPHCADAEVIVAWKQGYMNQTRRQRCLIPLPKQRVGSTP